MAVNGGPGHRILVVALNPALDITHQLPRVDWAGVNRPVTVGSRPGGKGLNVARTLLALGASPLVIGLIGGHTGETVRSALAAAGVEAAFTAIGGETRRTFAVVDAERGQTAMFNEPGPHVPAAGYAAFRTRYEAELAGCAAVVLTGSLPPGLPADAYAGLTAVARAAGVPVILDADGPALLSGVAAGPAIVKPNLAELAAALGLPLTATPDGQAVDATADAIVAATVAAAGKLRDAGAEAVAVSLGPGGLVAVTGDGTWRARPPRPVAGNATGAGDAAVAALAHGLAQGHPWPRRLGQAVALGAAAVAAPVAGEFAVADYEQALAGAVVGRLGPG